MDKLQMAIDLLQEARDEKERLQEYELERDKLDAARANDEEWWKMYHGFHQKWTRAPRKQHINDNIKMARRLLLDEYV